jgi:AmmeMemoRadiSam system protein A
MKADRLTGEERQFLLRIAREAIVCAAAGQTLPELELSSLTARLKEQGAAFVTLTIHDQLRGCIGALQASQPLALDVQEHAVAAATEDYRFPPVRQDEVDQLVIEISRLSPSHKLAYADAGDLLKKLRPGVDGVVLRRGFQRATFLPQVWANIPDPADFLTQLCFKMGASGDLWRREHLQVLTYQVEEFKEPEKEA